MVAIGGHHLIALFDNGLHADDHGFLTDIEMTKTADQTHAVHLSGPLFKAPDQKHVMVKF